MTGLRKRSGERAMRSRPGWRSSESSRPAGVSRDRDSARTGRATQEGDAITLAPLTPPDADLPRRQAVEKGQGAVRGDRPLVHRKRKRKEDPTAQEGEPTCRVPPCPQAIWIVNRPSSFDPRTREYAGTEPGAGRDGGRDL